jgi:hypothetical protein
MANYICHSNKSKQQSDRNIKCIKRNKGEDTLVVALSDLELDKDTVKSIM